MIVEEPIVITGMGVVTPAGCSLGQFWRVLCAGKSTAAFLPDPDFSELSIRFGCKVRGFDDCHVLTNKEARRMDPFARYAVSAAIAAYEDAGCPTPDPGRAAVVAGNGIGGQLTHETESRHLVESGPTKVSPLTIPMTMLNAPVALVAMRLGWRGPTMSISTACASGGHAIGESLELLRAGRADIVLAGGSEATLTPFSLTGFANLQALSRRTGDPERASRPFDIERDGFVMGEGAAFVVLERLGDAQKRGATPYAVLSGYASNTDAHHLVMPSDDGSGAIDCMSAAIANAGLVPSDIVHVNAHGTSTPLNDRTEAMALQKVFGLDTPPITSTKGAIGHLVGAAGAVELVASVLAIRHRTVPPTANYGRSEPGLEIDIVHGGTRPIPRGPVLSNSFGFGGHNACLVVAPA